ncbi:unnamed protein product [Blepharisma stoltei]|uniref:Cyclic nucleotide-binding domain-containing protein n=1 Tax=Blepharisma stoltei TaxID=1481888 RepID=A0AAU9IMT4_9CILI|nr:unnamed protein product [Blepharisma stoltei]
MLSPGFFKKRNWSSFSLVEFSQASSKSLSYDYKAQFTIKRLTKEDYFPSSENLDEEGSKSHCIFHPESNWKFFWNLLSLFFIFYQAIEIPFLLVFTIDDLTIWNAIDNAIKVFFLTDIAINFNTGFYKGGAVITKRIEIARNYLRFWFWFDLIATIPLEDLFEAFRISNSSATHAAQIINKLLRLIRISKLKQIIIGIEDYIASHTLAILLVFLRLVVSAYMVAHWAACVWYYIASNDAETNPDTWLNNTYMEKDDLTEIYITALYWAFTTMTTVGYGDVYPITQNEIIVACAAMAVACALFGYTVGSIGALVSKSNAESDEYRDKVLAINAYMKNKEIPGDLRFRVRRYLDYIWENKKHSIMGEIEILGLLSEPLKEEVYVHTRGEILYTCQVFNTSFQKTFILQLTKILEQRTFAPNDTVFDEGEKSQTLFFIKSGTVELYHHQTQSIFQELKSGSHFGEIAFFTGFPRCCSSKCTGFVETLSLSREMMDSALDRNPDAARACDYLQTQCHQGDLTSLGIVCYLCGGLGHVSAFCKKVLLNQTDDVVKAKWLKQKSGLTTVINPFELKNNRKKRNVHHFRYRAFNAVGADRDPRTIFLDDPALSFKINRYFEREFRKEIKNRKGDKNDLRKTVTNIDEILCTSEQDEERENIINTMFVRSFEFDRSLLFGSRHSTAKSDQGEEILIKSKSNPQEPKVYLNIPSPSRFHSAKEYLNVPSPARYNSERSLLYHNKCSSEGDLLK